MNQRRSLDSDTSQPNNAPLPSTMPKTIEAPAGPNPPRYSSDDIELPMEESVLDRPSLIATIESRFSDPACPTAFLLLVVLEDVNADPVTDTELVTTVGRHVGAMIRSTDLIATLDAGELAMVVFDLPPIQRVAFADGIAMAVNGVLAAVAPNAGLRALLGTSPMRPDAPLTDAFRQADRLLRVSDDELTATAR